MCTNTTTIHENVLSRLCRQNMDGVQAAMLRFILLLSIALSFSCRHRQEKTFNTRLPVSVQQCKLLAELSTEFITVCMSAAHFYLQTLKILKHFRKITRKLSIFFSVNFSSS